MMRHLRSALPGALLAGAVLLTACGRSGPELPTDSDAAASFESTDRLSTARAVHQRHGPDLMKIEGVVGTGLAADGNDPRIRVFTVHGDVRGIPEHAEGVPIQRVVTGLIVAGGARDLNDPASRERPAPNGFSLGHPDITAGTLGAVVRDADDVCYALSNNHILANSNAASIGDAALQPGPFDGGTDPVDAIGTLADYEPISFSGGNDMDAAVAELFEASAVTGTTPSYAYGAPGTSTATAALGTGVQKFGRTTGHTTGSVAEVNVTVEVCYETRGPFRCVSSAVFTDQFTVTPGAFSAGGDSGSLIVTDDASRNPVGLLFAGSETRTIANRIQPVLGRFGVAVEPNVADCGNADGGDPPDDDPSAGDFTLSVDAYKVRGLHTIDLSWAEASSSQVDVYRDGGLLTTTANDGAHTDSPGNRGSGSYTYQVCEAGSSTCSNEATAQF